MLYDPITKKPIVLITYENKNFINPPKQIHYVKEPSYQVPYQTQKTKGQQRCFYATYASRCIENEILMYLRRSNKLKGEISIDESLNLFILVM